MDQPSNDRSPVRSQAPAVIKLGLVAIVGLVTAVALASFGVTLLVRALTADSTLSESQVDLLLDDLGTVKDAGIWRGHSPRTANAAALLGRYVGVDVTPSVPPDAADPFTTVLNDQPKAWLEDPASVARFDPTFWAELTAFDHLDLRAQGTWARWLDEGGTEHGPDGGIPNVVPLTAAAKLHFAAALAGVIPLEQAIADVRRLGQLVATEPTVVGRLLGVSILGSERRALEQAAALGMQIPASSPPSKELVSAHFRLLMGAAVVLEGRAPAGAWERLQEAGFDKLGLTCSLARGTVDREHVRLSVLPSTLALEPDQRGLTALGRATLAECRDEDALAAVDALTPLSPAELADWGPELPHAFETFLRLPYLRGQAARLLLRGSWFGASNPYTPRPS